MPAIDTPPVLELKAILDAAGTMIIATALAGTVRIFNPASERLLGLGVVNTDGYCKRINSPFCRVLGDGQCSRNPY